MGKKKDERKRREREAEQATEHGAGEHAGGEHHKHEGRKHEGAAPFAGIAAAVARQMGTPVGRQMIAAGLMAAASAISRHDAKPAGGRPTPPPAPPEPPVPPIKPEGAQSSKGSTGPFAGDTPEPPRSDAPALPPEMAKVLDSVSVGLERLFAGFGKPGGPASAKKEPPAS